MSIENRRYIRDKWWRFGFLCLLLYWSVLIYVTLLTHNFYVYGRSVNLTLFDSIQLMAASGDRWLMLNNIIGNVALFFPHGVLLTLLVRKCRRFLVILAVSLGSSLFIESCQYIFAKRIFDIDDIFLNVIGAMMGWFLMRWMLRFYQSRLYKKVKALIRAG